MLHVTEIAVALRLPVSLVCSRPKLLELSSSSEADSPGQPEAETVAPEGGLGSGRAHTVVSRCIATPS
jgi:hypothetical protein